MTSILIVTRSFNIKTGKNILDLILPENICEVYVNATNSKDNIDSIYFYDDNSKRILDTNKENLIWYNELSDSIKISTHINAENKVNLIYYSDVDKKITITVNGTVGILKENNNYIESLNDYIERMDKKYETTREKIKKLISQELDCLKDSKNNTFDFPLSEKTYDHNEICAMLDVLLSDKLTMGKNVESFEREFANFIGSKYAVMVNSGSSANLLAMAVLSNFKFNGFKKGDKVIVPTICWSTSVWPIIQMGLEPIFIDVNIKTLNANIDEIERLLEADKGIKGMVLVHILGNTTNMNRMMELKERYNLIYMEDTCESLGSKYNNKYLGTFGECGTYSFYFSHHITTIEGGMVVTDSFEIYELLKCLRAHGWTRGLSCNNDSAFDNRFCFINVGYNLRPMEIQAAMGRVQLTRLKSLNNNRIKNYEKITNLIKNSNSDILTCFEKEENSEPAWFALPFILSNKIKKIDYLNNLEKNNIATRPIVTGNFARQPVFIDLNFNIEPSIFKNAEIIHDQGFFIGLPSYEMSDEKINYLVNILLNKNNEI